MLFSQENCEFESIVPELTEDEFENTVYPLLLEYFEHGDTNEVVVSVGCYWSTGFCHIERAGRLL